jgi:5-bromo-4-chloroindolyl phosphate hydrolysis protein
LHDEKGYTEFYQAMHTGGGKSYISQTNILGGLLLFLNKNPEILVKNIKKIIDIISYLSAWKAIEVQSPELNKQEIQIIANNLSG